jgi:N-acetylglucosaminyldiphosphoundecaprenol N-acetyl-beta-D-mannosaminyltransferase
LICLHWIRRQTNIDYSREIEADRQYVATQSLRGDLGIVLRALPALFLGGTQGVTADVATILDIRIDNLTLDHAVEQVVAQLAANEPSQVCFVNADCVNIAQHDLQYLEILRRADLTLADGIGLKLAGKILGSPIRQNVNGTDMFPRLCSALSRSGRGMFLLGGLPGVPEAVRDWLAANYPQVNVRGCHHGYFSPQQEPAVLRQIAESGAELLLVALGAPRQEKWIDRHQRDTGARVAMGVGGLFDFYSGRIPRCPQWLREMGLEWLYRFWQEPGRLWRRYFVGNGVFLLRVCWARLHLPTTLHRTA